MKKKVIGTIRTLVCSLLMVVVVSVIDYHIPVNHEDSIAVCSEYPAHDYVNTNN